MDRHDPRVEARSSSSLSSSSSLLSSSHIHNSTIGVGRSRLGPLTSRSALATSASSRPQPPPPLSHHRLQRQSTNNHLSPMADQRRHTVDFSNWTSIGLSYEQFAPLAPAQVEQQQHQSPSLVADRHDPQDPAQPVYRGSPSLAWDKSHSSFTSTSGGVFDAPTFQQRGSSSILPCSSSSLGQSEGQGTRTQSLLPPQHKYPSPLRHPGKSHLHPSGRAGLSSGNSNASDTFGRRASLSHLPLCGGGNSPWDQVRNVFYPLTYSSLFWPSTSMSFYLFRNQHAFALVNTHPLDLPPT